MNNVSPGLCEEFAIDINARNITIQQNGKVFQGKRAKKMFDMLNQCGIGTIIAVVSDNGEDIRTSTSPISIVKFTEKDFDKMNRSIKLGRVIFGVRVFDKFIKDLQDLVNSRDGEGIVLIK